MLFGCLHARQLVELVYVQKDDFHIISYKILYGKLILFLYCICLHLQ